MECTKDGLADTFAQLTSEGFLTDKPLLASLYGANCHHVNEKGHWVEVIASIFKKENARDFKLGEAVVNRLTNRSSCSLRSLGRAKAGPLPNVRPKMNQQKFGSTALRKTISITAPAWVSILCAIASVFILKNLSPMPKSDASQLAFYLNIIPAFISIIAGNIALARVIDAHILARLLLCSIYSCGAVLVQFFAIWWAFMTLHL
ncbi:MAG: hypothetical protein ABWY06_13550 [Pseudomonas sp.]|uniref:hypothetical protein n=1 Tax=Pseudomonas sp. TaxID=306 RepID=UPI0033915816